ncbi:OLC1v1032470C1 [Oldenlandia corymbosa var. corymbosa]|uniref:OLC1v1032470C1 n=1 Tax=Oldenlandia corymbosa var. corymbosa TaxID=529605 RepID=A0AAV1CLQ3_OLDCO|nr:OLC1v1032470C1 [Oldenlandia corymbosa var. corymbosa]
MMIHFLFVIFISIGLSSGADQYYDGTSCYSADNVQGTRYSCDSLSPSKCWTFLVYRANDRFNTIAKISTLFNVTSEELLGKNSNVTSSSEVLNPGREVVVPITCSCVDRFYKANLSYIFAGSMTLSNVACELFEGLVKSVVLEEQNSVFSSNSSFQVGSTIQVPLKCACPDKNSTNAGVEFLVTYPLIRNDDPNVICERFNISVSNLLDVNHLDAFATVYPNTTVLVPLKSEPKINFDFPGSSPPSNSPGFIPIEPVEKSRKSTQLQKVYISVSVVGFFLVLVTMVACGLYVKTLRKCKAEEKSHTLTRKSSLTSCSTPRSSQLSGPTPPKSSTASCLSPDLLEGIKYLLGNYTVEEMKKATNDFSEESRIMDDDIYKGFMDDAEILIKQTRFEDTKQVIDVHSKINHVHIVKLLGVCYGDDDNFSWCYLVFDYPSNGSLRGCLSSSNPSLRWRRRTHIAFDVATGLHYLHYCVVPPYTHKNVSSKTIFLTRNWRAKVAVFEAMSIAGTGTSKDHENISHSDHFAHAITSDQKEDIYAFGVVLLELISGKRNLEEKPLIESVAFLGGGASSSSDNQAGGCFDQLKNFVDPSLKDDYPLAEALCLAVLAKACTEDDPFHRPSMDDILKVLGRMV